MIRRSPRPAMPFEFPLFALTLLGVAVLHRHTLAVALTGLGAITAWKLAMAGFDGVPGPAGLWHHLVQEWVTLANLLGLLTGFALLARHFERSHLPLLLPRLLPDDWRGGAALLAMVFVLSSFLDNIAAALIGGALASSLFRARVHTAFLAAIVAASNAGGSGSVVGDTTTTMMWISGISPGRVVHAWVGAAVALVVVAVPAAIVQQRHSPIVREIVPGTRPDWTRLFIVALLLAAVMATNVVVNLHFALHAGSFPFLGAALWLALLLTVPLRAPDWGVMPGAVRGSAFLLSLVLCASMMPVESLPPASPLTALVLGVVSSVFDNIPLTALAIEQGGYDWAFLAFAVGFGGSMLWFGSSAGVALSDMYPQAKSALRWLRAGWFVPLAYLAGFAAMLLLLRWVPGAAG